MAKNTRDFIDDMEYCPLVTHRHIVTQSENIVLIKFYTMQKMFTFQSILSVAVDQL